MELSISRGGVTRCSLQKLLDESQRAGLVEDQFKIFAGSIAVVPGTEVKLTYLLEHACKHTNLLWLYKQFVWSLGNFEALFLLVVTLFVQLPFSNGRAQRRSLLSLSAK